MKGHRTTEPPPERLEGVASAAALLRALVRSLTDTHAERSHAWASTTAGLVVLLLGLQIFTGVLLAFYYVPTIEHAFTTVEYVEKEIAAGRWVRALHLHCSQLLPLVLLLHLAQMLWRHAHHRRPLSWLAAVALLGLVLANGAAGYSLPWDARALYSTRIAEGLTGGIPFFGPAARRWLLGGPYLSTLTLSRLYALHVIVLPAAIFFVAALRLLFLKTTREDADPKPARLDESAIRLQLARQAVVAGVAFLLLALYASWRPAPLGPAAESVQPGYLPRPGAQFLWLFQVLKYFPPALASVVALFGPGLFLALLAAVPFVSAQRSAGLNGRRLGASLIGIASIVVVIFSGLALYEDSRDTRTREKLARQAQEEAEFRLRPFAPARELKAIVSTQSTNQMLPTPPAYLEHCARCHGERGEGKSVNPKLVGVSAFPRRELADLVAIMNDPASYGLESRMPSFADKLSESEKLKIAEWILSLKK